MWILILNAIKTGITPVNFEIMLGSVENDSVPTTLINHLISQNKPEHLRILLQSKHDIDLFAEDSSVFLTSINQSKIDIFQILLEQIDLQEQMSIFIEHDNIFYQAIIMGELEIIKLITNCFTIPKCLQNLIHQFSNKSFILAAEHGQIKILEYLYKITPDSAARQDMLHTVYDMALRRAAFQGHLPTVHYLLALADNTDARETMISRFKRNHSHTCSPSTKRALVDLDQRTIELTGSMHDLLTLGFDFAKIESLLKFRQEHSALAASFKSYISSADGTYLPNDLLFSCLSFNSEQGLNKNDIELAFQALSYASIVRFQGKYYGQPRSNEESEYRFLDRFVQLKIDSIICSVATTIVDKLKLNPTKNITWVEQVQSNSNVSQMQLR